MACHRTAPARRGMHATLQSKKKQLRIGVVQELFRNDLPPVNRLIDCDGYCLRVFKIRHHFIGEQFNPILRPPGIPCTGVKVEGNLIDAELVA